MLTQKNIDDLIKQAVKLKISIEDAQDLIFNIIEDLLITGIKNLSFPLIYARLKYKYFKMFVQPYMFQQNKKIRYYKFVDINKRPIQSSHINYIKQDCINFIHNLKNILNPSEYNSIMNLIDENTEPNQRANVFRARKRFNLTFQDIYYDYFTG